MKTTFEDRLLDQLKRELESPAVAENDAPAVGPVRRRVLTPRRVTLGLAACAAAATAAVVLPGTPGGSSAYAVEKHPDGTVTVTIDDMTTDQAQQHALARQLRAAGVRVSIDNPPKGSACRQPRGKVITPPFGLIHLGRVTEGEPAGASAGASGESAGGGDGAVDHPTRAEKPSADGRPTARPRPQGPWKTTVRRGDTLIIENHRLNVGAGAFYSSVRGKAAPCDPWPSTTGL